MRLSIHAPRGGDSDRRRTLVSRLWFRSTPPRGGRRGRAAARARRGESFDPRPREGATDDASSDGPRSCFDPRPREAGDPRDACRRRDSRCFDPRPREGGDRQPSAWLCRHRRFRSTPPRGGDASAQPASVRHRLQFRSTPPRAGDASSAVCSGDRVSIHAPARRATPALCAGRARAGVSIHAPARRATRACASCGFIAVSIHAPARRATLGSGSPSARGRACFDPRPREGATRASAWSAMPTRAVSIHAPAASDSGRPRQDAGAIDCFDPRPRERGRPRSTPPRGGDLPGRARSESFDPRPREGRPCAGPAPAADFDPRPPRGAFDAFGRRRSFRSTPPRGATPSRAIPSRVRSTPREAGRPEVGRVHARHVSIHAPARRATLGRRRAVLRS